jgi:azurin
MNMKPLFFAGLLGAIASPAFADDCSVTVDSNDAMQFDTKSITVNKSCEEFTVNLTHSGQLAKNIMGHNWVLTKDTDLRTAATDGMAAGLDNNYVKPDDERVIAFTEIIGGGEKTSVTFSVSKLQEGQAYNFFCSFPGHYAIMQGTLTLAP